MASVGADYDQVDVDLRLLMQHSCGMATQDLVLRDAKRSTEPFQMEIRLFLDGFIQDLRIGKALVRVVLLIVRVQTFANV